MEQSASIENLAKAMIQVQKTDLFAIKDSNNPFFKSKYADLSSVWTAARQPLTENGLCVVQTNKPSGNGAIIIVTTLMHESGEWVRGELEITPDKNTPQGAGSAVTYGRRYGLQAIVGICPEDDDGNKAEGLTGNKPAKKAQAKPATPLMTDDQKTELRDIYKDAGQELTLKLAKSIGVTDKTTMTQAAQIIKKINATFAEHGE